MVASIGFTGTQLGMTEKQQRGVSELLDVLDAIRAHHGGCIGADYQFHRLCKVRNIKLHVHPSTITSKIAVCLGADVLHPPLPPLERNRHIVDASDLMIATPKGFKEEVRSGTWATVRYARRRLKKVVIVYPDGRRDGGQ